MAWAQGESPFLDESLRRAGLERLGAGDQGLARELALGAARWGLLYDHLAAPFLHQRRSAPALTQALRLGAHQLFALDRIPPHAAVGATVEALATIGQRKLTGVANAVLRRLATLQTERTQPGPLGRIDPVAHPGDLALRHSLPPLLLTHLREEIAERGATILDDLDVLPPLCTRTVAGAAPPVGRSILRRDGPWTWWEDPQEPLQGCVADGRCVVQDHAQGEPVRLAQVRPHERVLDLCAAPGGKARACAEAGAWVAAADVEPAKVRELPSSLHRLVQDGRRPALAPVFDCVVLDAPCSNSGVLARRPEARWRYDQRTLDRLTQLQRALLVAAARLVAPGGRLVYATCSITPAENQQITHRLDGWRVHAEVRSWPDAWSGGGYCALLVRS